jgi:hypothetical protein
MRLLKCRRNDWQVTERSNILQQDDMGYPLRLCKGSVFSVYPVVSKSPPCIIRSCPK